MGSFHFILFIIAALVITIGISYGGARFYNYIKIRGISRSEKVLLYFGILAIILVLLARNSQ
jgi:hypothetical protein